MRSASGGRSHRLRASRSVPGRKPWRTIPPAAPPHRRAAPPRPEPATPAPAASGEQKDPFGEEMTLTAKPIVYMKGTGTWDNAFETITGAFKTLKAYVDKRDSRPTASR